MKHDTVHSTVYNSVFVVNNTNQFITFISVFRFRLTKKEKKTKEKNIKLDNFI